MVTPIPGSAPPIPEALIAAPTKLSCVVLLGPPTRVPSSKILIDPGIRPPPIGTQYLSPGFPSTETI